MSIADELAKSSEVLKKPRCRLSAWLELQKPQRRDEIMEAFRDHRVMHRVLADWIKSQPDGYPITASSVSHHRNGDCGSCKRAGHDLIRP